MTPGPDTTCLGFEYFCQEGDGFWSMPDEQLAAKAIQELGHLGFADASAVIDTKVVRVPKAYPVYDGVYQRGVAAIREFQTTVPNLQLVGRNGMHRYNNQDHSMLTAMLAARNIMGANHDLWNLKIDSGYLEEGPSLDDADLQVLESTQPRVPGLLTPA